MKEKEDFLLIIDGSSLLSTQFFGNLPKEIMFAKTNEEKEQYFHKIMQTSDGVYTNAVYGFIRVLLKILKEQKPKYIAVTWDVSRNTFRREIYPEYKGNRSETIAPLKDQFKLCQEVLEHMNIPQFMNERYEADDFSGSLCEKFEHLVPIRIMTKDNDYLQLVSKNSNLWLIHSSVKKTDELYVKYGMNKKEWDVPERTFPFTPELVEEEFGIKPSSVPSLKGLQGDSSDNIKGVPGIGELTAVALIKEYKTVEALYDAIRDLDDDGKKKMVEYWKSIGIKRSPMNHLLKESGSELVGEKAAILSKELATIKRDIPLEGVTLEQLVVAIDKECAKKELDRLEFHSIKLDEDTMQENGQQVKKEQESKEEQVASEEQVEQLEGVDIKENKDLVISNKMEENKQQICEYLKINEFKPSSCEIVIDLLKAEEIIREIKEKSKKLTHIGLSFVCEDDEIIGLTIMYGKTDVYFIKAVHFIGKDFLIAKVEELLTLEMPIATFHLKKQLPFIHASKENQLFDVEVAAYLLDPNQGSYPYEVVAKQYLDTTLESKEEIKNKETIVSLEMDEDKYIKAVGYECMVAYAAYEVVLNSLKFFGMESLFYEIEMPLVYTLYDMECRGIRVNKEELKSYGDALNEKIITLEKEVYSLVGEEFNINSPKQLGVILFEKLKLPFGKKTKTGYSTSADVLENLKSEHEVVSKVLEYRQLTKLKSTYADGLATYIRDDGRIHGTFNQTITATGRISSTEPNLQNIPIRMELGRKIRKVFIPEEDYVFLDADYSQIELRVLADMSEDEMLIDAYKLDQDIHRLTASQVFHTPFDEVTSLQRSNAKAVNFGIVYGISAFSLAQDLDINRQEAEEYITNYLATYPLVKTFLENIVEKGKNEGVVKTKLGRIRPVPQLHSSNFLRRSAEERIAMNSPIQGTAADIIKIAMIRVNEALKSQGKKSRLLLQIHDELLVEAHISEIEEVKKIMEDEMQNAIQMKVPLSVEVKTGRNWYDAK